MANSIERMLFDFKVSNYYQLLQRGKKDAARVLASCRMNIRDYDLVIRNLRG
jgi:hypothetical protein